MSETGKKLVPPGAVAADTTRRVASGYRRMRSPWGEVYDIPDPKAMTAHGAPRIPSFGEASAAVLPLAGGMAGGMLGAPAGPPGMVAGAALGGAGGEAVRQLWEHAMGALAPQEGVRGPMSSAEAMGRVSRAGVEQGAGEAGGQLLAAGARAAAPHIMRYGLKMTPTETQKAARATAGISGEPDNLGLARVALRERVGSARGARARGAAASAEAASRRAASVARGEKTTVAELAEDLIRAEEKSFGRPLTRAERSNVIAETRAAANDALAEMRPGQPVGARTTFDAEEANQIKRVVQKRVASSGGYAPGPRGYNPSPGTDRPLARSSRNAVDRMATTAGPDADAQAMLLIEQAMANNEARISPTMFQMFAGGGAGLGGGFARDPMTGAIAAGSAMLATHPRAAQLAALGLDSSLIQYLLQQAPRSAVFGLNRINEENR